MRRDDELRLELDELVHPAHQRKLSVNRERGLRLVEDVEAVRPEALEHEREEGLAVRLLVQRTIVELLDRALLRRGREVEEALRAEEERVHRLALRALEDERLVEPRVRRARRELERLHPSAALGVQLARDGDRLDERRLAAAVVADEERDARVELERRVDEAADRRDLERVVGVVSRARRDAREVRIVHRADGIRPSASPHGRPRREASTSTRGRMRPVEHRPPRSSAPRTVTLKGEIPDAIRVISLAELQAHPCFSDASPTCGHARAKEGEFLASNFELRRSDKRSASAGRFRTPRFVFATALGVGLVCLLLLAQLASRQEQHTTGSPPAFLGDALGSPQQTASLVRRPASGLTLNVTDARFGLATDLASVTLSTSGSGTWRRFEGGAHRTTSFGSETVTFDKESLEQYLTVESRQGRRTWTWKLDGSARARLLDGGRVGFVDDKTGRVSDVLLGAAKIFDTHGKDVTPSGTRWRLVDRGQGAAARPRPRRHRAPGSVRDRPDRVPLEQRRRPERRGLDIAHADDSERRP